MFINSENKNLTFGELKDELNKLSEEELNQTATVVLLQTEEVIGVCEFVKKWSKTSDEINIVGDVLDKNHPYILIDI